MSQVNNYLSDSTVGPTTDTGGWVAEENAEISVRLNFAPYEEDLGEETELSSLKVRALMSGNVRVHTEIPVIEPSFSYKGSAWVGGPDQAHDGTIVIRFYDFASAYISGASTTFTTLPGFWTQVPVYDLAPSNAAGADIQIEFEDALPNEEFFISHPVIVQYNYVASLFSEYVEEHIPDFMVEADRAIIGPPERPLFRYIDTASYQLGHLLDTAINFDYVRATDSIDGEASNSSLTDPDQALFSWLGWLAQQVGVRLTASGAGFTNWSSFEGANIDTWQDWETDIVPGGSIDDTIWNALEAFDSQAIEDLEGFRNQIRTGFNGVMSSNVGTISEYALTLLPTEAVDPFVYIRKHYRTNPWRLAVVVKTSENPDPLGNTLEDKLVSTAPAGTVFDILNGVSRSALVLYDAIPLYSFMATQLPEGSTVFPATETNIQLKFIEDVMGTNRNILLYQPVANELYTGGGIALSRYFAIADAAGEHFTGHGLTSGYTQAISESHASLNLLGDLDIRVLVSDLRPVAGDSPRTLVKSENKWEILIDQNGYPIFEWENTGTESETATAPLNFLDYRPYWLRIVLDANPGTVTFYTAYDLLDEWTQLGETITMGGIQAVDSHATNHITIFSNSDNPPTGALGTVYRVMLLGTIDGSEVLDINFLDISNEDIFSGAETFDESGPNTLTITIEGAEDDAVGDYVPSKWLSLGHAENDYIHFGAAPSLFGGGSNLGDILVVSGLSSANRNYQVFYVDGTNASANLGTNTTYTFDSDDAAFGGRDIYSISVTNVSGGAEVASFVWDSVFTDGGSDTVGTDEYGRTWTLTRSFDTGGDGYEFTSFVDRGLFQPVYGPGIIRYHGYGHGASAGSFAYTGSAFSGTLRRYWDTGASTTYIADNMIVNDGANIGWRIGYEDESLFLQASDGIIQHWLYWDEVAADMLGEWNYVVANFNAQEDRIELWVNGELVDETIGFFPNQFLTLAGDDDSYASIPDEASLDFASDVEVWVGINSDDYFDAGNANLYKVLAEKVGAWTFGYNQQTGRVRFQWVDGSTSSYVTDVAPDFVDGEPIWLGVKFDADNGASGHDVEIFSMRHVGATQTLVDSETAGPVVTTDVSNNPVTIGGSTTMEPFDGDIYGVILRSTLDGSDVVYVNFSNIDIWEPTSVSGADDTTNVIVTLNGQATISRSTTQSNFPSAVPTFVTVFTGEEKSFQFAQFALYDHTLSEVAIEGLLEEPFTAITGDIFA